MYGGHTWPNLRVFFAFAILAAVYFSDEEKVIIMTRR
jgi:hypothetical protein